MRFFTTCLHIGKAKVRCKDKHFLWKRRSDAYIYLQIYTIQA